LEFSFFTVCVEVSPLYSLPITVCAATDSIVYQVAFLPSNNNVRVTRVEHSRRFLS